MKGVSGTGLNLEQEWYRISHIHYLEGYPKAFNIKMPFAFISLALAYNITPYLSKLYKCFYKTYLL